MLPVLVCLSLAEGIFEIDVGILQATPQTVLALLTQELQQFWNQLYWHRQLDQAFFI